jgi:hypothetical protein
MPETAGGPVLVGDRIVGVVMQALAKSQNIGYMVPVPVIEHFLTDMEDGRYDGFPEDGLIIQSLENESLKRMHGLKNNQSGALVSSVAFGSPAENKIEPGDVLLSVDGHPIEDDCTVEFRPKERTGCDFYVKQHQVGDEIVYKILRRGEEHTARLKLDLPWGNNRLVPLARYDVQPSYYVYGGLVFCPLTLNYLLTWGDNLWEDAPYHLMSYFIEEEPSREGEEVVIIIKVLAGDFNNGYDDLVNSRIRYVNGKRIHNLQELIHIVEAGTKAETGIGEPFVTFTTVNDQKIAIDRKRAEAAQNEILATYRIGEDRSPDLKALAGADTAGAKEISATRSTEAVTLKQ